MMYDDIYKKYKEVVESNITRDLFIQDKDIDASSVNSLINDIKSNKLLIYTAFTGDYDTLKDPDVIDDNCDYVCFTDNPNLKSDIWKIVLMDESILDNNRKAKQYKILPHKYFPEYKYSFWLDGSFKIKNSIREYIYEYVKSSMLCVVHTERDCIYKEAIESQKSPRYSNTLMKKQVAKYKTEGMPEHFGLPVLGAIFREHNNPEIIKLMEEWWNEIIEFTNQDQLSFSYLAWKNDFHPSVSSVYYWENKYWSKEKGEYHHKIITKSPATSDNLIAKLENELHSNDLSDVGEVSNLDFDNLDDNSEKTFKLSKEELYLLVNDVIALNGELDDKDDEIRFKQGEIAKIKNSSSFKLTKPLRIIESYKNKWENNPRKFIKKSDLDNKTKKIYLKVYDNIKKLALIDEIIFYNNNVDARNSDLDPVLFYLFREDKSFRIISDYFDSNFYKEAYLDGTINESMDPLVHYAAFGFDSGNAINPYDDGFIKDINQNAYLQYENGLKNKIANELAINPYITDPRVIIPYIQSKADFYPRDTIKVGVFIQDTFDNMNACPYIRLHDPLKELSKSKKYNFFVYDNLVIERFDYNSIINYKCFDIIIIQRLFPYFNLIWEKAVSNKIATVYETDDDLLGLDKTNSAYKFVQCKIAELTNYIKESNLITLSTPKLVEKYKDFGETSLIKNYYVEEIIPLKEMRNSDDNTIKIGYFGTLTHTHDLLMVKNIIIKLRDKLAKKGINLVLELVGGVDDNFKEIIGEDNGWFEEIPLDYYPMDFVSFMKWLREIANWDIGIAPLKDTRFNEGKSELKYIEFTALGVPVVASDIVVYNQAITEGVNGFLANNEEEWIEKLEKLAIDKELRKTILNNARKDIKKNYSLKDRVKQWDEILSDLANN